MARPISPRRADEPRPNYMMHPKDVRIAELEARLTAAGVAGDEKQ